MKELFDQHPLPWAVDDNRAGHEGLVTVFDANGNFIVYTGNMEDCTWEDILLARLIAAAPKLSEELTRVIDWLENIAGDMGCDMGNWDGGNAAMCEHCAYLGFAKELRAALPTK